jgi:hypothetical protein
MDSLARHFHASTNPRIHLSLPVAFGVIACVEGIRGELKVSGTVYESKQRGECHEENYFGYRSSGEFDFGGLR